MKKLLALLMALCMLASITAAFAEDTADIPLVWATSTLSQKFSPYFADTAYDQDVVSMTQISMMTTDRVGGIIYNGIEGETIPYNGTDYTYYGTGDLSVNYDEATDITTYGYKMREDLKFSDGEPVTIDDVIFTYYVYLDPAYNGSTTLSSYDILGLKAYRTQIPEASLDEVTAIADAVKNAYFANGAGYTVAEGDIFTQELYDSYANATTALWKEDLQGIVDYVYANYGETYAETVTGKTFEEVGESDALKVFLAGNLWGFAIEDPECTLDDLFAVAFTKYGGDFDAYLAAGESATGTSSDAINTELMNSAAAAAENVPTKNESRSTKCFSLMWRSRHSIILSYQVPFILSIFRIPSDSFVFVEIPLFLYLVEVDRTLFLILRILTIGFGTLDDGHVYRCMADLNHLVLLLVEFGP